MIYTMHVLAHKNISWGNVNWEVPLSRVTFLEGGNEECKRKIKTSYNKDYKNFSVDTGENLKNKYKWFVVES